MEWFSTSSGVRKKQNYSFRCLLEKYPQKSLKNVIFMKEVHPVLCSKVWYTKEPDSFKECIWAAICMLYFLLQKSKKLIALWFNLSITLTHLSPRIPKQDGSEDLRWATSQTATVRCVSAAPYARTGALLEYGAWKVQRFAMTHHRQDTPILCVHLECHSGAHLMGSVWSMFNGFRVKYV